MNPIKRPPFRGALVGFVLVLLAITSSRAATYIGSLQGSTGDYLFNQRTNSLYFYNGLAFDAGRLNFSIGFPLIYQNTPLIASSGAGMFPSGGYLDEWSDHSSGMGGGMHENGSMPMSSSSFHRMGIGDVLAHAEARLLHERGPAPSVSLTGDLKMPLASVGMGFGTGKWDYAAGVALSKRWGGVFTFLNAAYWVLGDLPGLNFNNPIVYSAAVGRSIAASPYSLLLSYFGSTRMISGQAPPSQIGLGLSRSLNYGSSLSITAAFGLTDTAPQFSLGLGWRFAL